MATTIQAPRPDNPVPPSAQHRHLRACMVCSIIQVQSKFRGTGCPNCESFLRLSESDDAVQDCTSPAFEGVIALVDPKDSWVARWQRLDSYVPGNYAIKVIGSLPEDVIQGVEDAGVKYIPRDGTQNEEIAA